MTPTTRCVRACALLVACALASAAAAQAPTAKITALALSVQHRVGATGEWAKSKIGTLLPAGSRVRTDGRSKAEIRFPDGSIVRMGPRSDLVIQAVTDRQMQLKYGTLWGKFISGQGARIQGGSAVAAIKGTTLDYSTTPHNDGTYTDVCSVYDTEFGVDFITSAGVTPLPAGMGARWRGRSPTLPDETLGGQKPDGQQPGGQQPDGQQPGGQQGGQPPSPPPATPVPPQNVAAHLYVGWSDLQTGTHTVTTPGTGAGIDLKTDGYAAHKVVNEVLPGTFGEEEGDLEVIVGSASAVRFASRPSQLMLAQLPRIADTVVAATIAQAPSRELFGKRFYGPYIDADTYGLWGETDSIIGARLRPSAVIGDVYVQLGANVYNDFRSGWDAQLSEAFAVARPGKSEIIVGRQHFLEGPVNNSDLGTVIGFDTIDAARIRRQLDDRWTVDFGIVFDYLPFSSETTSGAYLRAQNSVGPGALGLNLVHDDEYDLGFSVDLAWPAIPGRLDLYGEYGNTSEKKAVSTLGAYFPGLYQSADIDLFIERATRRGEAALWSLVAYKNIDDRLTGVVVIEKQAGEDPDFSIGGMLQF